MLQPKRVKYRRPQDGRGNKGTLALKNNVP